ncbi:MAG: hypothetical protein IKE76_00065, partial [Clostridia bacterium]|nr:hypothetical protein [Clostridia bacterium]
MSRWKTDYDKEGRRSQNDVGAAMRRPSLSTLRFVPRRAPHRRPYACSKNLSALCDSLNINSQFSIIQFSILNSYHPASSIFSGSVEVRVNSEIWG